MNNNVHFFRQSSGGGGDVLFADYQFNNDLIDDENGYNLTGTNITYNNGSAVFNGITSEARRTDTNNIFSFTDGVNDLPFRIETSLVLENLSKTQFIISKRDANSVGEWQLTYITNRLTFTMFSNGSTSAYKQKGCVFTAELGVQYDVVIDYDGQNISINVNNQLGEWENAIGNYNIMNSTNSDFLIGKCSFNSGLSFEGKIDYLKIYK